MADRTPLPTYNFAVVIVRHPETKKFLAVKETRNRGWWLPAGRGETFEEAAHRETEEEAGIKIKLLGILRVEHSPNKQYARMRVIYYAEPIDSDQPLKSIADEESLEAQWKTIEELTGMAKRGQLRGSELLVWGKFIEEGGTWFPMHVFDREGAAPPRLESKNNNNNNNTSETEK